MTHKAKLLEMAKEAIENSYTPYVEFRVAAAIHSREGNFYAGCNIQNAALPVSICAESSAIAHMVTAGDRMIDEILILSDKPPTYPCGSCCQEINEFCDDNTKIHMASHEEVLHTVSIRDLLPYSLDPNLVKE